MYIAIEGVKGVGKSTLVEMLKRYFMEKKIDYSLACPTKMIRPNSIMEIICKWFPFLLKIDFIKEEIYASRSNQVAKSINWEAPLILGDRSIISSYVSRFWKYETPETQLNKVDKNEALIPAPDYVIYMKAGLSTLIRRIEKRKRCYGQEDETKKKLILDDVAYEFIRKEGVSERLKKTQWIIVNADENPETVFEKTKEIINSIINKSK